METSKIFQFRLSDLISVEAKSLEEAKKLAADELESLSSSNNGSEFLANGNLIYTGSYICSHKNKRIHEGNFERSSEHFPTLGKWAKIHYVTVICKRCGKTLSNTETEI